MKRQLLYILIIMLMSALFTADECYSAVKARILDTGGSLTTVDSETLQVVKSSHIKEKSQILSFSDGFAIDQKNDLLLVVGSDRFIFSVKAYKLTSGEFIKDLGYRATDVNSLMKVFSNPKRSEMYIKYWDSKTREQIISILDSKTITEKSQHKGITQVSKISFSNDGQKAYFLYSGEKRVDIYNAGNLSLIKTVSLQTLKGEGVWGWGIEDFKNERALMVENKKVNPDDFDNLAFYLYDINDSSKSDRLLTSTSGDGYLLGIDDNAIFIEKKYSPETYSFNATGRVILYDLASREKIKEKNIDYIGDDINYLGSTPNGTTLYFYVTKFASEENDYKESYAIVSFDLSTFNEKNRFKIGSAPALLYFTEE